MECPDCKSEIGKSTYCGCGWKTVERLADERGEEKPRTKCEAGDCVSRAKVKTKISDGSLKNLCLNHYYQNI